MIELIAAVAPALIEGGFSMFGANKEKKNAKRAQQQAAAFGQFASGAADAAGQTLKTGIGTATDQHLNYLRDALGQQELGVKGLEDIQGRMLANGEEYRPYMRSGQGFLDIYNDMGGVNGADGQQRAGELYQSGPSANLLRAVMDQIGRQVEGRNAAMGSANSGAAAEELGRRLSDVQLGDYYNWRDQVTGGVDRGFNAVNAYSNLLSQAGGMAGNIAGQRNTIGNTYSRMGEVQSAGTVGAAQADADAQMAKVNYLAPAYGSNFATQGMQGQLNYLGNAAGVAAGLPWDKLLKQKQPSAADPSNWQTTMSWG